MLLVSGRGCYLQDFAKTTIQCGSGDRLGEVLAQTLRDKGPQGLFAGMVRLATPESSQSHFAGHRETSAVVQPPGPEQPLAVCESSHSSWCLQRLLEVS